MLDPFAGTFYSFYRTFRGTWPACASSGWGFLVPRANPPRLYAYHDTFFWATSEAVLDPRTRWKKAHVRDGRRRQRCWRVVWNLGASGPSDWLAGNTCQPRHSPLFARARYAKACGRMNAHPARLGAYTPTDLTGLVPHHASDRSSGTTELLSIGC
ncbi:hypothetical protein BD289DRAFT_443534 [Coniella lustricola]|uniref:Uncharacterized protein n=1 Tax=Coniella lustricola TaxID=2025994 RepID=A0A2T2ZWW3_9PEZI|nr:hypothetical protein BD289DRAFT_443534 [Coniella lustricola]